jgi:hypothetical protein
MNSKIVTGFLMISGFSGSGVVRRPPWRSTGLASFSHGQLHFMPFDPVNFVTTSVAVVVSIVEGLPGLAYVRRRVASTAVKKLHVGTSCVCDW